MQTAPSAVVDTFEFGSVSGSAFAFVFFLILSAAIGCMIYTLLAHPRFRRLDSRELGKAPPRAAIVIGASFALTIFLAIYFTAINGFYRLNIDGDMIRLHYILPARTYSVRRDDIVKLERVPGNRLMWRLRLETREGVHYQSAQSQSRLVDDAKAQLLPRVGVPE
jgi:hypothetical protein